MTEPTTCTKCGAVLIASGPMAGRCPRCLLSFGIDDPERVVTRGHAASPPPTPEELREHFPELEILELLGAGGMGAVYRAKQRSLDRTVALKVLRGEIADDPAFEERFHREARALARLNHPGIVSVFDSGSAGPYFYLLMEHVDGANLRSVLRSGELASDEVLRLVAQICDALQYAHREGVVHRDIKPENILVTTEGIVKIADFGLAKLVVSGIGDVSLTETAHTVGTLHYMAPEQIEKPGSVDHRADLYSLGVVFYELLTGELPLGRFMPPSEKVQIDVRLDEVVLKTLAKEPERRYQAADDIKTDVHRISTAEKTKGRCGPFRFGVVAGKGEDVAGVGNAAMEMIEELEKEEREEARAHGARRTEHRRERGRRPSAAGLGCGALGCLGLVVLGVLFVTPLTIVSYGGDAEGEGSSGGGVMVPLNSAHRPIDVPAGDLAELPTFQDVRLRWVVLPEEDAAQLTRLRADWARASSLDLGPVREWPRLAEPFAATLELDPAEALEADAILESTFREYFFHERRHAVRQSGQRDSVRVRVAAFPERRDLIQKAHLEMVRLAGQKWELERGREVLEAAMPFGDEEASVSVDRTETGYFTRLELEHSTTTVTSAVGVDGLEPPYSRLFDWFRESEE